MGLNGMDIGVWGWTMSLIGPAATLVLCELAKIVTYFQAKWYDNRLRQQREKQYELQLQAVSHADAAVAAKTGAVAPNAARTLLTTQQQSEQKESENNVNADAEQTILHV